MNNNKRIARIALLILCIVVVALVIGVAATHPVPASHTQAEAPTSVPAARPTTAPAVKPTSIPTIVPTARPTATSVPTRAHVLNNAQLGSNLASFKAKYGQDSPQSTGVTAFVSSPGLHEGSLTITYNQSGVVTYIVYAGPDGWTHAQYVAMMLAWIPSDAVAVKSTTDLITYRSVSIGRFDEQFTDAVAGVYSV